jgi:putative NADH-flavin reductase
MKVIVFGATGNIGRKLVQQSLEKNYRVTAFSRTSSLLANSSSELRTYDGDVTSLTDVRNAVAGHDGVFITLGSGKKRTGTVRSQGTKNIIQAMKDNGVRRLVCQTTLGCGDSKGNLNFFWKNIMFGWFLKEVFLDHELQEDYVKSSGLEWTIIRPAAFTGGPKTGNYKHGFGANERSLKLKISTEDVADFMIKEFRSNNYLMKTPGQSY